MLIGKPVLNDHSMVMMIDLSDRVFPRISADY